MTADLSPRNSDAVENKARELFDAGAVEVTSQIEGAVVAMVASGDNVYRVTRSANGDFEGCSCPAVARCSHIAAVELATALEVLEPIDEDRSDSAKTPSPAPNDRLVISEAPSGPQTDHRGDPPEGVDTETGEIVLSADSGAVDAALLPLSSAPITYQTLRAISRTEFVPSALRGKPEAVLAAVLYGRELGLGPMESLSSIDMIDGRPSPDSELLARLIRGAGHSIEVLEASDQACRLRGTRSDTGETLDVGYTIEDAPRVTTRESGQRVPLADTKRWREYPGDMCWARAISRLHRRLFPDVRTFASKTSDKEEPTA